MKLKTLTFKNYLRTVLAVVCAVLCVVAVRTISVDPYWLFQSEPQWVSKFGGHNRVIDVRMRHTKALQVVTRRPHQVILGSSRVYRGFDTSRAPAAQYYNMGFSSLHIAEAEAYVRHLIKWTPIERLVLGLDYFMFEAQQTKTSDFDPEVGSWKYLFTALPAAVITEQAWDDAADALKGERAGDGVWTRNGFKTTNDRDAEDLARVFAQIQAYPASDLQYQNLDTLLKTAQAADLEIEIFLAPVSSAFIKGLQEKAAYENFKTWRKTVRQTVENNGLTLFDFSEDTTFSTEPVMTQSTEHWIDPSHFKPVVGDWILEQLKFAAQ